VILMYLPSSFPEKNEQPPALALEVVALAEQSVYKPGPVGLHA